MVFKSLVFCVLFLSLILSNLILPYLTLSILSYLILPYLILSYLILFYLFLSHLILSLFRKPFSPPILYLPIHRRSFHPSSIPPPPCSSSYLQKFFVFLFLQEAIANLPLVVLISAMVSAGISKKVIGKVGSKVMVCKVFLWQSFLKSNSVSMQIHFLETSITRFFLCCKVFIF